MITQIFPQGFRRYLSLPVLGPLMEQYAGWLHEQRYTWRSARYELRMAAHAAAYLKRRAVRAIEDLGELHLAACHLRFRQRFPREAGSIRVLAQFLGQIGCLKESAPPPLGPVDTLAATFMAHLREVRGYAPSTVQRQGHIVAEFLTWIRFKGVPDRLSSLSTVEIEGFLRHLGRRMGRVGLQKPIAALRFFYASWPPAESRLPDSTPSLRHHESTAKNSSHVRCRGQLSQAFSIPSIGTPPSANVTTPFSR